MSANYHEGIVFVNAQIPSSPGVYLENDIPYHCYLFKRRVFFTCFRVN